VQLLHQGSETEDDLSLVACIFYSILFFFVLVVVVPASLLPSPQFVFHLQI
jgi:hypothetical protein